MRLTGSHSLLYTGEQMDLRRLAGMSRWQAAACLLLSSALAALMGGGKALAQGGDGSLSVLSDVLVKVLVIIDDVLGFFVVGNALTAPRGEDLVASLATLLHQFTDFVAQFSLLLTGNSAA